MNNKVQMLSHHLSQYQVDDIIKNYDQASFREMLEKSNELDTYIMEWIKEKVQKIPAE